MKTLLTVTTLLLLIACSDGRNDLATYTCPNGPDLVVNYTDDGARITFPTGRVELLPPTETEELYAKPGVVFDNRVFRTARLTDGQQSFNCDQMEG